MIAQTPSDAHGMNQFAVQMERIRRDCPLFVAWLEASIRATTDCVCGMRGEEMYRESGALRDLRQISGVIATPPAPQSEKASGYGDGMG